MMSNQLVFNPIVITRITIEGVELSNGRVTIKSGFDNGSEVDYRSYENKIILCIMMLLFMYIKAKLDFLDMKKEKR